MVSNIAIFLDLHCFTSTMNKGRIICQNIFLALYYAIVFIQSKHRVLLWLIHASLNESHGSYLGKSKLHLGSSAQLSSLCPPPLLYGFFRLAVAAVSKHLVELELSLLSLSSDSALSFSVRCLNDCKQHCCDEALKAKCQKG